MKIPVKLLANGVDQDRVGGVGKLIDPLCPERDSESHQQHRFDEHDRKLQVRRDSARDPFVVSDRITTAPKTNQDINKKCRPPNKKSGHEPMAKLQNVINLVAVFRGVWRLAEKFIDQGQAMHTATNLLPLALHAARSACEHDAISEK